MRTLLRRTEGTTKTNFLQNYTEELSKVKDVSQSEVRELANIQKKHVADIYIIYEFVEPTHAMAIQGDIQLWRKGSVMYNKYVSSLSKLHDSNSYNLQFGESVTGDHKVVPLKNSNMKIEEGFITIDRKGRSINYPVKMIKTDKPFCVAHREHGNITLPAGTYMSCVSLDPKTFNKMLD